MSLRVKLLLALVCSGLLPGWCIGYIILQDAVARQEQRALDNLSTIRDLKAHQIDTLITTRLTSLESLEDLLATAIVDDRLQNMMQSSLLPDFTNRHGFSNLIMLDLSGFCFYSVQPSADYKTNLLATSRPDTHPNLATSIKSVINDQPFAITDLIQYDGDERQPKLFLTMPVKVNEQTVMIIAAQLPVKAFNQITLDHTRLGNTGRSYLVGADMLARSDIHLDNEPDLVATVSAKPTQGQINTSVARSALSGNTGKGSITNSYDVEILSTYTSVSIGPGLIWALLVEQTAAEALAPLLKQQNTLIKSGLIVTLLTVILALVVTNYLTRPVILLQQSLDSIRGSIQAAANIYYPPRIESAMEAQTNDVHQQFNDVMSAVAQTTGEIRQIAAAIDAGDLTQNKRPDHHGTLQDTTDDLNHAIKSIAAVIQNLHQLAQQARTNTNQVILSSQALIEQGAHQDTITVETLSILDNQSVVNITQLQHVLQQFEEINRNRAVLNTEVMTTSSLLHRQVEELLNLLSHFKLKQQNKPSPNVAPMPEYQEIKELVSSLQNQDTSSGIDKTVN
jgi:methyl-accepting chemotaxis protein